MLFPVFSDGSLISKRRKRKEHEESNDIVFVMKSTAETEEKLSMPQAPAAQPGKFHWLGKFIADSLLEIVSETVKHKVMGIVQILNKQNIFEYL